MHSSPLHNMLFGSGQPPPPPKDTDNNMNNIMSQSLPNTVSRASLLPRMAKKYRDVSPKIGKSYADDYNKYCLPPKFHVDEYERTRELPQLKSQEFRISDRYKLLKTGGFKVRDTPLAPSAE